MALGCTESSPEPPSRPDYVPQDAEWIGGWDGGRWHHCKLQTNGLIECTQWAYGDVYTTQNFKLCGPQNPSKWAGFISGSGEDRVSTKATAFELVPVGPMTVYKEGKLWKDETENARSLFPGELDISCPVQLVPGS